MKKTDYNIPIFEDEDISDLNEYSEKMAEALVEQLNKSGNYKGQISTVDNLPNVAEVGDLYNVISNNKNYIWNGTEWIEYFLTTLNLSELEEKIQDNTDNICSDAYDSTKTYGVGDYCIKDNALYKCTTAITTAEEWTSGHWEQTSIATELSNRLEFEVVEEW